MPCGHRNEALFDLRLRLDQEGMEQALEISEIKKKNQEELEQQHLVEYKLKKDQDMLVSLGRGSL